ncbi:hydrogenase 4 subunit F [Picrophilus oshimae]|uniref:Hydrogenase-4 component F n=1 Tax=Picrophilus torridus (strain ATCC 700027 / DSM 9790 / JCM 10055 / NBRC 100828 / KAW 2/3) TaxID=1122961 RepID=A0A8G2FVJ9_PICTO|nr:hydrogenase 4 subunit F [Picrophilus oshimae]SMD30277.1 hydrogenase-4 component F [Picrophilus oshimae DSM 9789]
MNQWRSCVVEMIIDIILMLMPLISIIFYKYNNYSSFASGIIAMFLLLFIKNSENIFLIDSTSRIFIFMILAIYTASSIYGTKYIKKYASFISYNTYFLLNSLFAFTMLFTVMINNYGFMWVGIEGTTISSALMVITEGTETAKEATWRYIIIVSAGISIAFIAIILIYYSFHTLTVSLIINENKKSILIALAVALSLIGFGTKAGIFPMHSWLPDAHSEAPAPTSAMFSGVLLPVALYVVYRIYEIDRLRMLFIIFSITSMGFAAIFLSYQTRYKRMFAYSTMENMSMALLGIALGGYAFLGAIILLLAHSFGKAGAFFSSGNILYYSDKKSIFDINSIYKNNKVLGISLLLSSLAVTGTPPFGTFIGEFLIIYGIFKSGLWYLAIPVIIFIFMAFVSINMNVTGMMLGDENHDIKIPKIMLYTSLIMPVISLIIGLYLVVYHEIL